MFLARQIDLAARRRHGPHRAAVGAVTPALIRHYDGQARDLRAAAQALALRRLLQVPLAAVRLVVARPLQSSEPASPRR